VALIGSCAFDSAVNLEMVKIGNAVTEIESSAFEDCISLKEIETPETTTIFGSSCFAGCKSMETAVIHATKTNIGEYIFDGCTALKSVDLPTDKVKIENYMFRNCTSLKDIVLPETIQAIGESAFYNCDALTGITIPAKVTSIGDNAFYDCDALTGITIHDGITSIGSSIFYGCELLKDVSLGMGISKIPAYAFHGCPSLETIVIPYYVTELGDYSFKNCTALKFVTMPRGLEKIGTEVFSYPGKMTIYGISGTYAETYANNNNITFVNQEVPATAVTLPETLILNRGASGTLALSVTPSDFTDEIDWKSADESVATVSAHGVVTGKAVGETMIKVTVGNASASCKVTVVQPVNSISVSPSSKTIEAAQTFTITAAVYPDTANNKTIEWTSSDETVATVTQEGIVTTLSKGTADITATAKDGSGKSATCVVTVTNNALFVSDWTGLESPHPYVNNCNDVWVYTMTDAKKLFITFDGQTSIEDTFDFLYIYDAEGNEVGKYTGTALAGKAVEIPGNTVKIQLKSDNGGTDWGFKVIKVSTDEENIEPEEPSKLPVPVPDIVSGSKVEKGTKLVLSCADGASIYYTVDGTDPTQNSTLYSSPIIINADITIKAMAVKEDFKDSEIATFTYFVTISDDPDIPDKPDIPDEHHDGLWIAGLNEIGYFYTGEAVKPEIKVYDNTTLLVEKTDYTISYKNNTKVANSTDAKAPTITVIGKGNYSGKETVSFNILPVDISSDEVYAFDFYVKTSKKVQKPVPKLYYMGTMLKNNKDFTMTYSNTSGIYTETGEHTVTIQGIGNYTGTRQIRLTAVDKMPKSTAVNISKAKVRNFDRTVIYTGEQITQDCMLYIKNSENNEVALVKGMDYTVSYSNNIKAGTATAIFYGKNGYTGKLKKTYKITPYDILNDYNAKINFERTIECVFAKGGSKPKPVVTYGGKSLKEGTDYTLSYKNNKAVAGNKIPYVIVTGKGNFKGKLKINMDIKAQDLSKMTLMSCDKIYKNKPNIYRITPKLADLDGKQLTAGKDFDKRSITYSYANDVALENGVSKKAGDTVESTDIIPADTLICITLDSGTNGNYTGTFKGTYRIVKADIKSAKVTISDQIYTGSEITPDKTQITIKHSGVTLEPEDYEITGYSNNIKKGKASVTLRGIGNYGGTKTVKFNIRSKGFLWWWR